MFVRLNVAFPYGIIKKNPDHHGDKQRQQLRTLFKDNKTVVRVVCAFVGSCLADSNFDLVIITFLEQGTQGVPHLFLHKGQTRLKYNYSLAMVSR